MCIRDSNPADIISRGCLPDVLRDWSLWWHGPSCLSQSSESNPFPPFVPSTPSSSEVTAEEKHTHNLSLMSTLAIDLSLDFSSLHRLTRVYAYCFRFIRNIRLSSADKCTGDLTPVEIHHALNFFIKQSQSIHFAAEINCLRNGSSVSIRSKMCIRDSK